VNWEQRSVNRELHHKSEEKEKKEKKTEKEVTHIRKKI